MGSSQYILYWSCLKAQCKFPDHLRFFISSFGCPVRQKLNEAGDIVTIKLIYEDGSISSES